MLDQSEYCSFLVKHLITISKAALLKTTMRITEIQFRRSEKRLNDALDNADTIPISTLERRYLQLKAQLIASKNAYKNNMNSIYGNELNIHNEEKWIEDLEIRQQKSVERTADIVIARLKHIQFGGKIIDYLAEQSK